MGFLGVCFFRYRVTVSDQILTYGDFEALKGLINSHMAIPPAGHPI
jgi:hypothetical protein